jgi:anti-sigma regulatory factor (Ser/Thr protein kinase)
VSGTAIKTTGVPEITCTTLPAPTVPARIRRLLEQHFAVLGLGQEVDRELRRDILLSVSELVTNACTAAPHTAITFRAVAEDGCLTLCVWDTSNAEPTPRTVVELELDDITPDPNALDKGHQSDEIGGLGLPLVMALANECGVDPTPPTGKWVWARFHLPPANTPTREQEGIA